MKPSTTAARLYLYCAGIGYFLIGLGFAGTSGQDSSPAILIFPALGSLTATVPHLMFAACRTVFITDSYSACAASTASAIGLFTVVSVKLIEEFPWLIWILYVFAGNALISAILNPPDRGYIVGPLMSVATAYAFFFAVHEIHRASAKGENTPAG